MATPVGSWWTGILKVDSSFCKWHVYSFTQVSNYLMNSYYT